MARWPLAVLGVLWLAPLAATGQDSSQTPLSAIDWLSQSVTQTPASGGGPAINEPPVSDSATSPSITVTPLDSPSPDPVGLLSPAETGLPRTLWSGSDEAMIVTLVQAERVDSLPAVQELLVTLMLAEADPPLAAGPDGRLFLARVDKLLDHGAVAPARTMLERAGIDTPAHFRRWFDIALLTGNEDAGCDVMQARPDVAPTYPARIFCLARNGDWNAAALTLNTHRALGDVTPEEEDLLTRFLDPDLAETAPALGPPSRISPLVFRMREAIGQGVSTGALPRAFAHADLRDTTGWKSQLEAAERLTRHGAIPESVLAALYQVGRPAASGGVWDRAEAMQRFAVALQAGDPGAVAATLPDAWDAAVASRTEVPFAAHYHSRLGALPLTGDAAAIARTVGLLSPGYEAVALDLPPDAAPFLAGLARGIPQNVPVTDARAQAVAAAFDAAPPPDTLITLATDGKLGEALLRAIAMFNAGLTGDPAEITDALAFFRHVGLEDVARRAGLQLLLLDRET